MSLQNYRVFATSRKNVIVSGIIVLSFFVERTVRDQKISLPK